MGWQAVLYSYRGDQPNAAEQNGGEEVKGRGPTPKGLDYTLMSLDFILCAAGATKDVRKRSDVG